MARKRRSSKVARKHPSATTCSVLKKRIGKATTRTSRGKALGAYAKAGCAAKARRRKRRS